MGRRQTVHWAIGISVALVLGSAAVALVLGAAADPPIDRVGSFQSISTELSGRNSRPTHSATIGSALPNIVSADDGSPTTPTSVDSPSPTSARAENPSPSSHNAGDESLEREAQHDRRDD